MGRPPIRKKGPFTAAERQARRRRKLRRETKEAQRAIKQAEEAAELKAKGYSSPLQAAKETARNALHVACGGDPRSAVLYERWFAHTLSAADGRPPDVAEVMWMRVAEALAIMVDMRGWPAGKVQGVTVDFETPG